MSEDGSLLNVLRSALSGLVVAETTSEEFVKCALRWRETDDFCLEVYVYSDGEPQIVAVPRTADAANHEGARLAFWTMSFERAAFASNAAMRDAFFSALRIVSTRRMRVTQHRIGPVYEFVAEFDDAGEWRKLSAVSWLRGAGVRFLRSDESRVVLHAGPVSASSL